MNPVVLLICCASIATGAIAVVREWRRIRLCIVAQRWQKTAGRLISVEDRNVSGPEDTTHEIRVRYLYSVGGRDFEGGTIHPAYAGGVPIWQGVRGPGDAAPAGAARGGVG